MGWSIYFTSKTKNFLETDIQKKSRLEGELESLLWVTNYEI